MINTSTEPMSQPADTFAHYTTWSAEWMRNLDERQQKEVRFAVAYRDGFAHGTDGHHRLPLIAKLADLLTAAENGAQCAARRRVVPGVPRVGGAGVDAIGDVTAGGSAVVQDELPV